VSINIVPYHIISYRTDFTSLHNKLLVQSSNKKVITDSEAAIGISLVPDTSMSTGMFVACGKHSRRVPLSTLNVLERVVVREVVAVRNYVVVGTRTGQTAAELSDCNQNTQTVSACT